MRSPPLRRSALTSLQEMAHYDEIFKTIEGYKNMTIEALQYSKIGKGKLHESPCMVGSSQLC